MEKMTAIESSPLIYELPDFLETFISVMDPYHVFENLFIFPPGPSVHEAAVLLAEAELLQEIHPIIRIDGGKEGADFFDVGFRSGSSVYLFCDLLVGFKLGQGEALQKEMALLQLEEHLAFSSGCSETIYFTLSHYVDLIKGIVKAYGLEAEFLNLDK